jgi:hypothetical protein
MTRRRVFLLLLVPVLLLAAGVTWSLCHLPPPRLIMAHGWPGGGGAGARRTILGVEFVELRPGYVHVDRHPFCIPGDFLGRICDPLGIPLGDPPRHCTDHCRYWAEISEPVWIATAELSSSWIGNEVHDLKPEGVEYLEDSEALPLISGKIAGSFRLATQREWDYAFLTGAIRVEPGSIEFGAPEADGWDDNLQRPDEERAAVFFGMARYRLIWTPPGE